MKTYTGANNAAHTERQAAEDHCYHIEYIDPVDGEWTRNWKPYRDRKVAMGWKSFVRKLHYSPAARVVKVKLRTYGPRLDIPTIECCE